MNKNCVLLTGLLSLIGTLPAANRVASLQEGVELRRIAEYCKEKNFSAVKTQIHIFLNKYPHSDSTDALHAMKGDIFFTENAFDAALASYNSIKSEEFKAQTEFRRIHCLHQLSKFDEVIGATTAFLKREKNLHPELPTLRMQLAHALLRQSLATDAYEDKHKYLHLAKEQFKLLAGTAYADQTIQPLAYIHYILKEYPQAVRMYQILTEKDPNNKEEHLLQTLQLQLKFDRSAAIETCQKIYALNGKAAPTAAFNQLSLLFQEKRYRDIALLQNKTIPLISAEQQPLAHYYVGRSLFHIGDFSQASLHLDKYLSNRGDDLMRNKNALLTLIACAKEKDDFALLEKTLVEIKSIFPQDMETIKVSLLHAQQAASKGQIGKAANHLKELLDTCPELPQKDNVLYDYAQLLSQQKKWHDSVLAFDAFIKQYPAHPQYKSAWRNIVHCHFNSLREASKDTAFVVQEDLSALLTRALKQKGIFSPEERKRMRFSLASALYETHKYDKCLGELAEYVKDFADDPEIASAYVMTALCHYHGNKDLDLFSSYAVKALEMNPALPAASQLHLTLFNIYLNMAEMKHPHVKNEMLLKAADHLYKVADIPIKKSNQLWLADFYFVQYKESGMPEAGLFLERSIGVFEKILEFNPKKPELTITADKMEKEAEAIKLSELYGAKKMHQEKIALLKALAAQYKAHPEFPWKYQRLAHFELATAFKEEKQFENALSAYAYLIESSSHAASYFSIAAQLEKTLLEFSLLQPQAKSTELQAICDSLKDLEIKRKLYSEPCHLEAALAYIDIQTDLASKEEQAERRLLLLDQLQFSFSCQDDPLVMQYLSTKEEFPEKHTVYSQYMQWLGAEILGQKAIVAYRKGNKDDCLALSCQAMDKLFDLSSSAVHPRLKERIEKSRESLKAIL